VNETWWGQRQIVTARPHDPFSGFYVVSASDREALTLELQEAQRSTAALRAALEQKITGWKGESFAMMMAAADNLRSGNGHDLGASAAYKHCANELAAILASGTETP
jgi:hypothetical protein